MKKLFFVTSSYPSHDIKFIKTLIRKGLEISVFIIRPQTLTQHEKVDGVEYIYRKRNNFIPYRLDYLLSFLSLFFILKDRCNRDKPDILHGGNIQTAGFLCSIIRYGPFLLMPYGSDALILPRKNLFLKLLTKYVVNSSDSITCDAMSVKKSLLSLVDYKNEVLIFPWGVDQAIFNPNVNPEDLKRSLGLEGKKILLCSRAHYKVYGIEYLISSLRTIVKKFPDVHLILMGYTPLSGKTLTETYKFLIKKWDLESHVTITEPVNNEEMPNYLAISDIYISTSFSDGTSVSLIEAMSMSKPVVVSDIPSNREWISDAHNGLLCKPGDSYDISLKIIKLLSNKNIQREFGLNNLSIARKMANWKVNTDKLYNLYSRMSKA